MFEQILVAIDRSATSKQVFNCALSLADGSATNLILLHVSTEEDSPIMHSCFQHPEDKCIDLDSRITPQANETCQREWEIYKQEGLELLRFYAKKAIAAGIQTEFTQIIGRPGSTICEFARSCRADVVVIGRSGFSNSRELLLGSVSDYVVHYAPCSVLMVPTPVLAANNSPPFSPQSDWNDNKCVPVYSGFQFNLGRQ